MIFTASLRRKHAKKSWISVTKRSGLLHAQNAVLDQPAAARKRKQPLGVVGIGATQSVVIVIDHVGAGMGHQRKQHGQYRFEQVNGDATGVGRSQADQCTGQGDAEKRGAGGGKVQRHAVGEMLRLGF